MALRIIRAFSFFSTDIETIREYLETRSDKSISSDSLCDLANYILKNNQFENEELKYHQKRGFAIGTKFNTPYSNFFYGKVRKENFSRQ